ncbi:MAG TPA: hypothetical protein ENN41_03310 [Sediminispirochaeta sp.]|nr:hypothetical protein [Sediminispirochaeta sp.]
MLSFSYGNGKKLTLSIISVLTLSLFFSCGQSSGGYGVVLLSPDQNSLPNTTVVEITDRSDLRESYTVTPVDGDGRYEIDTWRIEFFKKRSEARQRAEEYGEYLNIWARNLRDGLAIRESPDSSAKRVYRMRPGQEIKILELVKEDEISGQPGNWYRVLTKDGTEGYSFDYYLQIFDITAKPEEQEGPDLSEIKEALQRDYRPESFEEMVENERIRLDRFSTDYGFFPDLEKQEIEIRMHDRRFTFQYDSIKRTRDSRYLFMPDELEVVLRGKDKIQTIFTDEDQQRDYSFIYIEDEEIEDIRQGETERREALFQDLLEKGPRYTGSAYGSISFQEDNKFLWQDFQRLVPTVIPNPNYREGRVSFDHFLAPSLKEDYQGVLALRYSLAPNEPILFLYSLENERLRLEYVPPQNVDERVVTERSGTPLIMAFSRDD